ARRLIALVAPGAVRLEALVPHLAQALHDAVRTVAEALVLAGLAAGGEGAVRGHRLLVAGRRLVGAGLGLDPAGERREPLGRAQLVDRVDAQLTSRRVLVVAAAARDGRRRRRRRGRGGRPRGRAAAAGRRGP